MTEDELLKVLYEVKDIRIGTIVVVAHILDISLLLASLLSKGLDPEELFLLLVENHTEKVEEANLLRIQLQINVLKTL